MCEENKFSHAVTRMRFMSDYYISLISYYSVIIIIINSYKPGVPFVGHWQTEKPQM